MEKNSKMSRVVLVSIAAIASLMPLLGSAVAEGPGTPTYARGFASLMIGILEANGVHPSEDARNQIEFLGTFIDDELHRLTTAEDQGPLPKILPIGIEGCTGAGACGGHHQTDSGKYTYYVQSGNLTQGNNCNGNTVILNTWIGGEGDACYNSADGATLCAANNCTNADPGDLSFQFRPPIGLEQIIGGIARNADDFMLSLSLETQLGLEWPPV